MKKVMAAFSILFMVMLIESSSAISIIEVDSAPGYSFTLEVDGSSAGAFSVEDESSASGAFKIETEDGGFDSLIFKLLGGSAGSLFKLSQYDLLYH